ncbi:MAG TPA: ArsC/Spx/MgsR family protein, partial [Flavobacteriales bacterium]|nr:ArsC/Spx/MgsR family protein [Flavobacteriales bacterium]
YHLSTCSTCKRILSELKPGADVVLQDIKSDALTETQVDDMAKLAGSYEAIFSRVAMKYRALGLDKKTLSEKDYKKYILEEYTFLRRPVVLADNRIFIGNSRKIVESAAEALRK